MLKIVNRPCFATFGVPIIYTPSLETRMELGGIPINLVGIFDEKRETISLMGNDGLDAIIPRSVVEIQISDLGIEPMDGDDVMVAGVPYRILEVQPDGNGLAVLILARMQDPFAAF